jgi:hypothetical protein
MEFSTRIGKGSFIEGKRLPRMAVPVPVNPTFLQSVNARLRGLRRTCAMLVYPVPTAVTQARIQLVADQTEKAPRNVIRDDVLDVFAAKNQAEREALVDRKA